MLLKNLFTFIVISLLIVFFMTNCARKGRPNGGPKDSIAPIMVTAIPAYKTIHFKSKKIKLSFDEYIKIKDLNKQLIVSPPLKTPAIISPIGTASKDVTIKITDTLKENTTYSFNFGNSIIDNNEGNQLESFKYIFSTGNYVDSLEIQGTVMDAYKKEPEKNIAVLLYEVNQEYNDSIIYHKKPTYVSNTLDTVHFKVTNIKAGTYQLMALKDFNNDYIYDPKVDKIAFTDKPIQIPSDSLYTLRLFQEALKFKLMRPVENKKGKIFFGFKGKLEPVTIKLLTKTPPKFKNFIHLEKDKDTLNYWYTPFEADSLQFQVIKGDKDSIYTVNLRKSEQDSLIVTVPNKNTLHPKDTFAIETNIPIDSLGLSYITITDKDTLSIDFTGSLNRSKTKLSIDFNRSRNNKYQIDILPNTLVDFYGNTNDTLTYSLKTLDLEDYGIIEIQLKNINKFPVLIDLINAKEDLVERQISNKNTNISFTDITPGSYTIRVIYDENKNNQWDTGDFLQKKQPEKIAYFNKELELRANWTLNEIFDLSNY